MLQSRRYEKRGRQDLRQAAMTEHESGILHSLLDRSAREGVLGEFNRFTLEDATHIEGDQGIKITREMNDLQ